VLADQLGPGAKGYGAPEVQHAYDRARELCRHMEEMPQLFPVLRGLSTFYSARAELQTAHELAEELLRLAQRAQDPAMLVEAYSMLGTTSFYLGVIASARAHLEQGVALYGHQQHRSDAFLEVRTDPGVLCFILHKKSVLQQQNQFSGIDSRLGPELFVRRPSCITQSSCADEGLHGHMPTRPGCTTPPVRFLFVAPHIPSALPSDPTSR
jgi:hypothetical protein